MVAFHIHMVPGWKKLHEEMLYLSLKDEGLSRCQVCPSVLYQSSHLGLVIVVFLAV